MRASQHGPNLDRGGSDDPPLQPDGDCRTHNRTDPLNCANGPAPTRTSQEVIPPSHAAVAASARPWPTFTPVARPRKGDTMYRHLPVLFILLGIAAPIQAQGLLIPDAKHKT